MTVSDQLLIEGGKLVLQFVGALLVARLAVRWALSRYKSEKTWERQVSALSDAITSLSEMRLLVGQWFDHAITYRELLELESEAERNRYQVATRKLQEGIATAQLILPTHLAEMLGALVGRMQATRVGKDYVGELDDLYCIIDQALNELIVEGRKLLGVGDRPQLEQATNAA